VRNAERSGEALRRLRSELVKKPAAAGDTLLTGLSFLRGADLRHVLAELDVPVFWLLGERDTLVPAGVRQEFPGLRSSVIPGAAHAPFLSHPDECTQQLKAWLLDKGEVVT
jgi:pimeloyl-[acyl-carrier protein] methyl ester esterase